MEKTAQELYSGEFYAEQVGGSVRSAAAVVPILLSFLPVKSAVDVGCGVGSWAAEFLANGVPDVWGLDGDYVDRSQLRIPPNRFLARDLTQPLRSDRTFDLAICLEVGEHLPESRAREFVIDLTSLAPCVLFSAAVPGQDGTDHINEQYLPYWIDLFQTQGYEAIDPIRPLIFGSRSVEWWYQQNIVVFVAPGHPLLAKEFPRPRTIIHPHLYERTRQTARSFRTLLRALPGAALRSLRQRRNTTPARAMEVNDASSTSD
jgi:SAM-dependent methyltransferase